MVRVLITIAFLLFLLSARVSSISRSEVPALLYTVTTEYQPLAWINGRDRFPQGATIFVKEGEGRRPLVKNFAASADPAVSFDAARVLFAGKKNTGDKWQIWEMPLDGKPRQVTWCESDCVRPLYLPGDRVTFAEKIDSRFRIVVAPVEGGAALPVTYSPASQLPTDVLRDGRILLETAQQMGGRMGSEIYTVYTDGSGVEAYRCDHGHRRYAGKQVGSGDVVFAEERGLARFTSALAHQVPVAAPPGDYAGDIAETSNGVWLLTSRSRAHSKFEIFLWMPGSDNVNLLVSEPDKNAIQPTVIFRRPLPNRHPSGLHDWSYANLLCLSAYTSKTLFKAGAIASVRLYAGTTAGSEKLLGESRVEKDGSFYLRTPADQPLRIELRDAGGKTLQKEAGWFWLRRGEQRVCVGCHAGPETAPENEVPAVLLRSTVATDMTTSSRVAAGGH